jgi:hypothetical protein|tara:strand:+ start:188 stop:619 length:432 start_codon:yes stop_codon:yes gene_type:complete
MSAFQMEMSKNWSNAIGMYMALDWGLKCESLNPPYASFHSPKTNGKVRFEIYFTNYYVDVKGVWVNTDNMDTKSLGNSDYIVLCIWNKQNNNCVVLKTEDAVMLMANNKDRFPLASLVPFIKRKFEIGVNKMDNADLSDEATS